MNNHIIFYALLTVITALFTAGLLYSFFYRPLYNKVKQLKIAQKNDIEQKSNAIERTIRDETWQDISYKAAHKLGNPIEAIGVYRRSLLKKLDDNNTKEAMLIAKSMFDPIEEAKAVLAEFKSLSKITELKTQFCDIEDLIRKACNHAMEHDVKVTISNNVFEYVVNKRIIGKYLIIDSLDRNNRCIILIDKNKLKSCFDELVANALHHFDKEVKVINVAITIVEKNIGYLYHPKLSREKRYLKVVFSDNGKGIKKENKSKIFLPFYTLSQHGSGLGLSIVEKIILLHGGVIMENGKYGEGASFDIYIPITKNNFRYAKSINS